MKLQNGATVRSTASKCSYLWPSINLEDLRQGDTMLVFINARGRNEPGIFAFNDYDASRVGRKTGAIQVEELPGYLMFLDGRNVEMFGRLEAHDGNHEAISLQGGGMGSQPGAGLLVLEILLGSLDFLNGFCRVILHDIGDLLDDQIPNQSEPEAILTNCRERLSLICLRSQQPCRTPSKVDFEGLSMLAAAQQEAVQDHIFALREDPGYFADVIADWTEHRSEQILDSEGNSRLDLSDRANQGLVRTRVVVNVVVRAYGDLLLWHGLRQLLTEMAGVTDAHDLRLLTLLYAVRYFSNLKIEALKCGIPASPPLRSGFCRQMHNGCEMLG